MFLKMKIVFIRNFVHLQLLVRYYSLYVLQQPTLNFYIQIWIQFYEIYNNGIMSLYNENHIFI